MCWKCSLPIDNTREIFRTSVCPECGSDLHSCKNCRFYEVGSHYDCHETIDELVKDKETKEPLDYTKRTGYQIYKKALENFIENQG